MKAGIPESMAHAQVAGLVLAGGEGRRLGGVNKGLVSWHGRAMAACVSDSLRAVVPFVLISANRALDDYRPWGDEVVSDSDVASGQGPLAGLLAGMVRAQALGFRGVLVSPCDTPNVTPALFQRLLAGASSNNERPVLASVDGRFQPLHGFYPAALASALADYLVLGERRVEIFARAHDAQVVDCSDRWEDLINLNRPEDFPEE